MPKVLIIAYYWPPAGGGGVQRWLKFTKYLPEFGWQPVVYVPYNPQYPLQDLSLVDEVAPHVEIVKGHIWEARRFYRRLKKIRHGKKWSSAPEMDTLFFRDQKQLSWFGRLSLFLRSNLFVPDSRSLWIRPSYRRLKKWLKAHPVDAIVSTGPPHSCHLIASKLRKATGIPWIADFRDPWLEIDYFPQLALTQGTRRKHERLQHEVMTTADKVITVSWSWADLFRGYGAKNVQVITNGYDTTDIIPSGARPDPNTFIISSIGTLELDRFPKGLWSALKQLISLHPDLATKIQLHFAGKIDLAVFPKEPELLAMVTNHGYLPHKEAINLMHRSDVLLLLLNETDTANSKGRIPGKLFEYLATGKPVLMLGLVDSDSGMIVSQLSNSWCVGNNDDIRLVNILVGAVQEKDLAPEAVTEQYSQYERRNLTRTLAGVLDEVSGRKSPTE